MAVAREVDERGCSRWKGKWSGGMACDSGQVVSVHTAKTHTGVAIGSEWELFKIKGVAELTE